MSRYPSALWRPIRDTSTAAVRKDILCLHTMVGSMRGTWAYFDRLDVKVYSHLLIGGIWGGDAGYNLDGVAWQAADTDYRAAANLDGNWHVISVETADNAARPIAAWTPKQCDRIVLTIVDAHRTDGIPLVMIPDTKLGRRGIAYHRLGCDPYRVSSGELWSSAYGKDCPTDVRIRQLPMLIERARDIVNAVPEEDDVTPEEHALLADAAADGNAIRAQFDPNRAGSLIDKLNRTGGRLAEVQNTVEAQDAKLAEVLAAVKALTPTPPPAG